MLKIDDIRLVECISAVELDQCFWAVLIAGAKMRLG